MGTGIQVLSLTALRDLASTLKHCSAGIAETLEQARYEFEAEVRRLEENVERARRTVERWEQRYEEADDDDERNYAERRLDEARERLDRVLIAQSQVDEKLSAYLRQAERVTERCRERAPEGCRFLEDRVAELETYLALGVPGAATAESRGNAPVAKEATAEEQAHRYAVLQTAGDRGIDLGITSPEVKKNFKHDYRLAQAANDIGARNKVVEAIGLWGAGRLAAELHLRPILEGKQKGIVHGYDAVYEDPGTGLVFLVEAKGGRAQRGTTAIGRQGGLQWIADRGAMQLRRSHTSESEKVAAEKVLEAWLKGKLVVWEVRTSHKNGYPTRTRVTELDPLDEDKREAIRRREI